MRIQPLSNYKEFILRGDRWILAKAITLIESRHPDHREVGRLLVEAELPHTGEAIRLGLTGVQGGGGESTFIDSLGMQLLDLGHKVAVLAVDPSSQRSGAGAAFCGQDPCGGTMQS